MISPSVSSPPQAPLTPPTPPSPLELPSEEKLKEKEEIQQKRVLIEVPQSKGELEEDRLYSAFQQKEIIDKEGYLPKGKASSEVKWPPLIEEQLKALKSLLSMNFGKRKFSEFIEALKEAIEKPLDCQPSITPKVKSVSLVGSGASYLLFRKKYVNECLRPCGVEKIEGVPSQCLKSPLPADWDFRIDIAFEEKEGKKEEENWIKVSENLLLALGELGNKIEEVAGFEAHYKPDPYMDPHRSALVVRQFKGENTKKPVDIILVEKSVRPYQSVADAVYLDITDPKNPKFVSRYLIDNELDGEEGSEAQPLHTMQPLIDLLLKKIDPFDFSTIAQKRDKLWQIIHLKMTRRWRLRHQKFRGSNDSLLNDLFYIGRLSIYERLEGVLKKHCRTLEEACTMAINAYFSRSTPGVDSYLRQDFIKCAELIRKIQHFENQEFTKTFQSLLELLEEDAGILIETPLLLMQIAAFISTHSAKSSVKWTTQGGEPALVSVSQDQTTLLIPFTLATLLDHEGQEHPFEALYTFEAHIKGNHQAHAALQALLYSLCPDSIFSEQAFFSLNKVLKTLITCCHDSSETSQQIKKAVFDILCSKDKSAWKGFGLSYPAEFVTQLQNPELQNSLGKKALQDCLRHLFEKMKEEDFRQLAGLWLNLEETANFLEYLVEKDSNRAKRWLLSDGREWLEAQLEDVNSGAVFVKRFSGLFQQMKLISSEEYGSILHRRFTEVRVHQFDQRKLAYPPALQKAWDYYHPNKEGKQALFLRQFNDRLQVFEKSPTAKEVENLLQALERLEKLEGPVAKKRLETLSSLSADQRLSFLTGCSSKLFENDLDLLRTFLKNLNKKEAEAWIKTLGQHELFSLLIQENLAGLLSFESCIELNSQYCKREDREDVLLKKLMEPLFSKDSQVEELLGQLPFLKNKSLYGKWFRLMNNEQKERYLFAKLAHSLLYGNIESLDTSYFQLKERKRGKQETQLLIDLCNREMQGSFLQVSWISQLLPYYTSNNDSSFWKTLRQWAANCKGKTKKVNDVSHQIVELSLKMPIDKGNKSQEKTKEERVWCTLLGRSLQKGGFIWELPQLLEKLFPLFESDEACARLSQLFLAKQAQFIAQAKQPEAEAFTAVQSNIRLIQKKEQPLVSNFLQEWIPCLLVFNDNEKFNEALGHFRTLLKARKFNGRTKLQLFRQLVEKAPDHFSTDLSLKQELTEINKSLDFIVEGAEEEEYRILTELFFSEAYCEQIEAFRCYGRWIKQRDKKSLSSKELEQREQLEPKLVSYASEFPKSREKVDFLLSFWELSGPQLSSSEAFFSALVERFITHSMHLTVYNLLFEKNKGLNFYVLKNCLEKVQEEPLTSDNSLFLQTECIKKLSWFSKKEKQKDQTVNFLVKLAEALTHSTQLTHLADKAEKLTKVATDLKNQKLFEKKDKEFGYILALLTIRKEEITIDSEILNESVTHLRKSPVPYFYKNGYILFANAVMPLIHVMNTRPSDIFFQEFCVILKLFHLLTNDVSHREEEVNLFEIGELKNLLNDVSDFLNNGLSPEKSVLRKGCLNLFIDVLKTVSTRFVGESICFKNSKCININDEKLLIEKVLLQSISDLSLLGRSLSLQLKKESEPIESLQKIIAVYQQSGENMEPLKVDDKEVVILKAGDDEVEFFNQNLEKASAFIQSIYSLEMAARVLS